MILLTYKFNQNMVFRFFGSFSSRKIRIHSSKGIVRNGKECKKLPPETIEILPFIIEKYD